ncbi:WD repeat-containing protein 83 [Tieghemiomyces parasiticus]|uniref:WD repeat-containing protein 83 n=1 Tax=Tieghemiomyces parasiticus TaxID=78921 RepID=A0A9W8DKT6_9FUNG|nr:WD repeat-containing protein 83 [Tieghemiomyces parasiticus]
MTADFVGSPVTSVGYAQDGQCLLVSSLDSTVRLLDKAAGTLLNHYEGHRNGEYRLRSCLSRLDSLVISGSEDGRLWCWDLMEATCAREWQAHPRVVTCVAYHPTEPALLSTSVDGTVYIWR